MIGLYITIGVVVVLILSFVIIYNVLVSLQTDARIWGIREFGKEKTEVML